MEFVIKLSVFAVKLSLLQIVERDIGENCCQSLELKSTQIGQTKHVKWEIPLIRTFPRAIKSKQR